MTSIEASQVVFWDFDGVIKDSVDVKAAAYERLFMPFGIEVARRVRRHHDINGGVSRLEKIPLYLEWAGQSANSWDVEKYCQQFSQATVQAVIDAPWVPGVREYLLKHYSDQYFVLVTATPKDEIEQILVSLKLSHCFQEVFGAPTPKDQALKAVLDGLTCGADQSLMIGDSESDLIAAQVNLVPFLLRRTPLNRRLQVTYQGPAFDDFNGN